MNPLMSDRARQAQGIYIMTFKHLFGVRLQNMSYDLMIVTQLSIQLWPKKNRENVNDCSNPVKEIHMHRDRRID